MIQLRHAQPTLWHKGLRKDIEDLWEPWMREDDRLLDDARLLESVYGTSSMCSGRGPRPRCACRSKSSK